MPEHELTDKDIFVKWCRLIIEEGGSPSWEDIADLTHETQVAIFGWCGCEDNEENENPYSDCPPAGEPRYL